MKICQSITAIWIRDESLTKEPQSLVTQAGYLAVRSMQSHGFRLTEKCGWKKDVHGREAAYAVRYLKGWSKLQIPTRAQNSLPRAETLWMNFEPAEQMTLTK